MISSLRERFSGQSSLDSESDGVVKALTIPEEAFHSGSPVYFLRLSMTDEREKPVDENFYWLSAKKSAYRMAKDDLSLYARFLLRRSSPLSSISQRRLSRRVR